MSNAGPSKSEIEIVFNRLRSQVTNKSCFDCNAKNPTWASVTYGVFICIDCSAVHRSLGVHLTFVRSTNLDTNWTWIQLRQMQVGGNASASQFFRQHNCQTSDAQQKYNSRAAQLYRDKLQTAAQNAMKLYGTKLHLDSSHEKTETDEEKQTEDFFAELHNDNFELANNKNNNFEDQLASLNVVTLAEKNDVEPKLAPEALFGEPSVDLLNSVVPTEKPKSTIGVRKIQPKKSGIGAKKGVLGATKVKTNFADIEQRANLAYQHKEPERVPTAEEEIETVTSVRLAYQDLSIQRSKEEEKLKTTDPMKAKQLERLGMGFNMRGGGVSHSAISDMKTIAQESAPKSSTNKSSYDREPTSNDSFDEYSTPMYTSLKHDKDLMIMGFEAIEPIDTHQSTVTTMFSSAQSPSTRQSISQQPGQRSSKISRDIKTYENDEAQKKFGNSKGISSDQFFDNDTKQDASSNLSRFQGSNSISSSDFFGDGSSSTGATSRKSFNNVQFNAPDLDEVTESVRQGVTKVAGRMSTIANDVMFSLKDRLGY